MKTSLFATPVVRRNSRRGMTLVELLVVVSIMVILVAVSIPVFKPMLESQRTAGAARVVAGALQRTRVKALQDRKTYGLEFVRFLEGNAPNVSLQLRLIRERTAWATPEDLRVVVINGTIHVCTWNGTEWTTAGANKSLWESNVQGGYQIQLGRQGRLYDLATAYTLAAPYDNLTLPDLDLGATPTTFDWALEAVVSRPPLPAIAPQVVLPKGGVVDLAFSGTQRYDSSAGAYTQDTFSGAGPVAVMFSPGGYVDGIMNGGGQNEIKTNEVVYFCIGEWERQSLNAQGDTYAEDGRSNLLMTSNFWVTVAPRSGQVRITEFAAASQTTVTAWENAPDTGTKQQLLRSMISEVRRFATDQAMNLGGF